MIETLKTTLEKLDKQVLERYEDALGELRELRYVFDSEGQKAFLSGKMAAYEDVALLIKTILSN